MGTLITRTLPVGLQPTNGAQPTYYIWVPSAYDGSTAWPVILHWHGSGEAWAGTNQGAQMNTGTNGLAQVVNQLRGAEAAGTAGTAGTWVESDWPAIIVFPQYGTTTTYPGGSREQWIATAEPLSESILTDLTTNLGYNVDTSRLYLTGCSGGAYVSYGIAIKHPTKYAGLLLGAGGTDARIISWAMGQSTSPAAYTNMQAADVVAQQLKDLPIWITGGQGDANVSVDGPTTAQLVYIRFIANAFRNPANVGAARNFIYTEHDDVSGSAGAPTHQQNFSWPFYSTEKRDWLLAQKRGRPAPTWADTSVSFTVSVPGLSADVADVPVPIVIAAGALPQLKDTAHGGVMQHPNAWDLAFYLDAARTIRTPALKVRHDLTTGAAYYIVNVPSGLHGRTLYLGCGAAGVTYNVNADGRAVFPYTYRRWQDFGDGTTFAITDLSATQYPDKVAVSPYTFTWSYGNGTPATTPGPLGGTMVTKAATSKYAYTLRAPWDYDQTTTPTTDPSGRIYPWAAVVVFRQNGAAPTADQTLLSIQSSSVANPCAAISQTAGGLVRLRTIGVTVTSTNTVGAGWNTVVARLTERASRDLYLNPADGVAGYKVSDTVSDTTVIGSGNYNLGVRITNAGQIEKSDADLAAVIITEFASLTDDLAIALDRLTRQQASAVTISATAVTPPVNTPAPAVPTRNAFIHRFWSRWRRR